VVEGLVVGEGNVGGRSRNSDGVEADQVS
jgi:hypothetical protein